MTYGPLKGKMVHFTYDCRNRLVKAGDTEYTYDAENIRTSAVTPDYTEEYITDSTGSLSKVLEIKRVYKEEQIGYNIHTDKNFDREVYYYGNGLAYEKLYEGNTKVENEGNLFVYHYDHLGSTKLVTNKDGSIVSKYNYGTYGELLTTEYGYEISQSDDDSEEKPYNFKYSIDS